MYNLAIRFGDGRKHKWGTPFTSFRVRKDEKEAGAVEPNSEEIGDSKMKKFLAVLLALVMVFVFAACGESGETVTSDPNPTGTTSGDTAGSTPSAAASRAPR